SMRAPLAASISAARGSPGRIEVLTSTSGASLRARSAAAASTMSAPSRIQAAMAAYRPDSVGEQTHRGTALTTRNGTRCSTASLAAHAAASIPAREPSTPTRIMATSDPPREGSVPPALLHSHVYRAERGSAEGPTRPGPSARGRDTREPGYRGGARARGPVVTYGG